ncbi:FlaA1/EpsC-like NDP-sugar epimerase [Pacificibacter maritimus]|uniref:FlaA1/EpsC-like NDP-sugar epimerase n=1 Tax=Pacificibacter maritimus TaxID=762213 RepID=A0A3N4UR11_9RHOB|nr:nucleoside-diphosphate sugar epimerase/dehydratase [Pacificibacter maritimus]RPE63124.1 FlaA1/EpsC-like NDP-sugar epimerase [Pacificibacter maritimus]
MLVQGLTNLPARFVRIILVCTDMTLVICALGLSFTLLGEFSLLLQPVSINVLIPAMAMIGFAGIIGFGLHRIKLVMFGARDVFKISLAALALSFLYAALLLATKLSGVPSKTIIFGGAFFCLSIGVRVLAIATLSFLRAQISDRRAVAIFGAGGVGIQLASALRQSSEMRPVFFFDDNPNLQGMAIGGIPVLGIKQMKKDLTDYKIDTVLVALPEEAKERRAAVIEQLEALGMNVRVLPSVVDLLVGRGNEALFRTVSPDEILGRDAVDLEVPDIAKSFAGRVVMVTGAGGSIGSELSRQIFNCRPAKIVLFDQSEFNLYQVDFELKELGRAGGIEVVTCLGSVTDPVRVRDVMTTEKVEIVFHAAAYKHVPMIEENELEGASNNVIGTKVVADAAAQNNVERFILVSTDKAVRPTNIMGATKRMAELVIQDIQTRSPDTLFSMVRFGNVLGSSGSVLPLFQTQIEAGGPVTVTHAEVTRFFMTISEAARLVLLAGAYAQGGDVFVLDMGKPQKIMEIARRLIKLSGRTVKESDSDVGDIEIKVTGLRPGEKLYEELLLDHDNLCATPHPKILRAEETKLSQSDVAAMLLELNVAIKTANASHMRKIVRERVDGYAEHSLAHGTKMPNPS